MKLLVPWTVDGVVPELRRSPTSAFLRDNAAGLASAGIEVVRAPCHDFSDYQAAWVKLHAESVPYGVLEQDVVPESAEYLAAFLSCPETLCVAPVEQHVMLNTTQMPMGTTCRFGTCDPWSGLVTKDGALVTTDRPEYIQWSVSALLKVGGRLNTRPLDFGPGFSTLDSRFYNWATRDGLLPTKGVHVHWPSGGGFLEHNHPVCRNPEWPAYPEGALD